MKHTDNGATELGVVGEDDNRLEILERDGCSFDEDSERVSKEDGSRDLVVPVPLGEQSSEESVSSADQSGGSS